MRKRTAAVEPNPVPEVEKVKNDDLLKFEGATAAVATGSADGCATDAAAAAVANGSAGDETTGESGAVEIAVERVVATDDVAGGDSGTVDWIGVERVVADLETKIGKGADDDGVCLDFGGKNREWMLRPRRMPRRMRMRGVERSYSRAQPKMPEKRDVRWAAAGPRKRYENR